MRLSVLSASPSHIFEILCCGTYLSKRAHQHERMPAKKVTKTAVAEVPGSVQQPIVSDDLELPPLPPRRKGIMARVSRAVDHYNIESVLYMLEPWERVMLNTLTLYLTYIGIRTVLSLFYPVA
jgi:hypothetical protein